ncbi:protein BUNDLE SHEATH DEFECTIVE 2, chloroplastic-like [Prosopis cineraria]|uniref:protein BUNDLE SHEATH DEFECTIVE 2, chloroplastic-like n=1 Tax=Prosopis cineraria TaxID=364024 RepID=UPI0024105510|nr:protein BUNDLE SHEATH DEFECTIVE 2, chloroplastic-like [Prosopis cineraria]
MAHSVFSTPICSLKSSNRPGIVTSNSVDRKAFQIIEACQNSKARNLQSFEIKATDDTQSNTKVKSIICSNCEGNGAVLCSQCKGTGVNSVDHFNGQFKAGGLCWLCRGKKQVLCGECNGAGFLGGFLSSFDD